VNFLYRLTSADTRFHTLRRCALVNGEYVDKHQMALLL